MCFKSKYYAVNPAYKKLKDMLKLKDMVTLINCQIKHDQINGKLPGSFNDYFKRTSNQHNYNTGDSKEGKVIKLERKTTAYGVNSLNDRAGSDWNEILKHIHLESNNNFH